MEPNTQVGVREEREHKVPRGSGTKGWEELWTPGSCAAAVTTAHQGLCVFPGH